jgi:hypothetical protein
MSPAPTPSVRTTSERLTSRSEGTTPPVVRRNATSAIVCTHVVGNLSMANRKLLAGPAFPQQHEGGVIVGARIRGADRRREGQRAVGPTRGVPTGATNSAIAALLKSRYDRARPCWPTSTTVPTAEFSRQPRIHLVHERGAQLESESQSRYGDRVRRDLWVRLAVGADERRFHVGLSPPCEGVVGYGTLQPRSTSWVVVVASAFSGAARSMGPRLG